MRSDQNDLTTSTTTTTPRLARKIPPELPQDRRFYHERNYYCSRSEAACAALIEKYLNIEAVEGKTFQVRIGTSSEGHDRHVDFYLLGVAFEFHPFHPPKSPHYWKMLHRLEPGQRDTFRAGWARNDAIRYYDTRRKQLDAHPWFRNAELVVATSREEFYDKIIARFTKKLFPTDPSRQPSKEKVLAEFEAILREVEEIQPRRARHIHVRTADERGINTAPE